MRPLIVAGGVIATLAVVVYLAIRLWPEDTTSSVHPPISRMALLNASDVTAFAKQAVNQDQPELIQQQLDEVVLVAKEMGFADTDLAYFSSQQAYDYLLFQAKRSIFDDKVAERYRRLLPIDDLKANYPEAQDRFADADAMIAKRDRLFAEIVSTLQEQGLPKAQAKQQATQLWQEQFAQGSGANQH